MIKNTSVNFRASVLSFVEKMGSEIVADVLFLTNGRMKKNPRKICRRVYL